MTVHQILILGKGGQGTTFLGQLLAESVNKEGHYAVMLPQYELGILGGNIKVYLTISTDKPQLTHYPSAFNIVINLHYQPPVINYSFSESCLSLNAIELNAHEIAHQMAFPQGVNIFILGVLLAHRPICSPQTIAWLLKQKLGSKRKNDLDKNLELFKLGISSEPWKTFTN